MIFPVAGSKGNGKFTIRAKCEQANQTRQCLIQRCDLAIEKTQNLDQEQYLGKALVIYDRKRHGPLNYESESESKSE